VNLVSFRVYDKKKKKFVTDNVFLTPDGELVESKKSLFGSKMTFVNGNRFVYQRYIGLEDQNGNPIYIGDYLEAAVTNEEVVVGIVTFAEEISSYIIMCFENEKWYTLGTDICDRIQVVGNVFDDEKKGKKDGKSN
jgi:hypothetical protein